MDALMHHLIFLFINPRIAYVMELQLSFHSLLEALLRQLLMAWIPFFIPFIVIARSHCFIIRGVNLGAYSD